MASDAHLKNARCCAYWAALLEECTAKISVDLVHCKDASQELYKAAIKRYCDYYSLSKEPKPWVSIEIVFLALTQGFVSSIPKHCLASIDVADLFSALKYALPSLNAALKEDIIKFLIDKHKPLKDAITEGKPLPKSRQWLYDEGLLSPSIYRWLVFRHDMKTPTQNLLKFYIAEDKPEIISALLEPLSPSKSLLQKLVDFASKKEKLFIVSLLLHKMESFSTDAMKSFAKSFSVETIKNYLQTCSPEKNGEFLNFCFCSNKIEISKRSAIAIAILESHNLNPTKIDLNYVLKFPKLLLFHDMSFLKKLLDAGVPLDCSQAVHMIIEEFKYDAEYKSERVELACILLERGADVKGLEVAYSGSGGTVIHAAIELALQTDCFHIFELTCSKCDATKCLYDKRKLTPLHVVMKQRECSQVAIDICHFLCHELKINPFYKDQDGRTAKDYCKIKNDKRLEIINDARNKYHRTTENVAKNGKVSRKSLQNASKRPLEGASNESSEMTCSSKKRDKEEKAKDLPNNQIEQGLSRQSSNPSPVLSPVQVAVPIITEDNLKSLITHVLSKDKTYFVSCRSKRQSNAVIEKEEIESEDEIEEKEADTKISNMKEVKYKYDVFCSPRVKKFIEKGRFKLVERVLNTMERLACGETVLRLKRKMNSNVENTIFHGNVDSEKRVIWHTTVSYSPSKQKHCEVLVLLDVVLNHDELNKAVKNAENWIKRGEEEGCKYAIVKTDEGDYKAIPESEASDTSERVPLMMRDNNGAVPIYSLPEYVLQAIRESSSENFGRLGLPLKLSHEEHDIVRMDADEKAIVKMSYQKKTILVVGRSGTGKTTCCLSRMWEEFRHYWEIVNDSNDPIIPRLQYCHSHEADEELETDIKDIAQVQESQSHPKDEENGSCDLTMQDSGTTDAHDLSVGGNQIVECDHLHQVFVTKSHYLCQEVKHRFYDLVSSHNLLKKYKDLEHKPLPSSLNDKAMIFPLFVTSRDLLMLMDSTLEAKSFFQRKNGKLLDKVKNSEQVFNQEDIGLLNDTDDEDSDSEDESDNELEDENIDSKNDPFSGKEMIEVTASLFQTQIWSEISSSLKNLDTKKIDPILVWQEIKSFIKGSIEALKSNEGYLSEEEYLKIGKNKARNFENDDRRGIYTLFLAYQKYCKSPADKGRRYFDECDLLHHLYKHCSNFTCVIHNFYIDEVQDFTEAELYLLLSLSQCPNGNFLCGDSAQSIMRGVSFRFTDVRSLFHNIGESFRHGKVLVPKMEYLTINYRAHAGILSVADSVIELLGHFFKDSFDKIPGSNQNAYAHNVRNLQKPSLLFYDNPDELTFMLAGNQFDGGREIEFGAHQAVIVPSKDTVLPDSLKRALVFTVLEAKGLEFNDVLLFNFFSESKVNDKNWELVSAYTCINVEKSEKKIATKYRCTLKEFEESRYKTLNAELKCLYTAITRAKRNLWICDSTEDKSQHPMYDYFLKKDLVKTITLEDSGANFATERSTAEEWKKAGDYLMSKRLWKQALTSYERAQAEDRIYQVHAFMEVERNDYAKAAAYFLMADKVEHERKVLVKAARCLRVTKFKCSKDEKLWYYSSIAQFFEKLGNTKRAGEFYILAESWDRFIAVSEVKKRYNRVIGRLLAQKQKLLALRKAAEYGEMVTIRGFEIKKLAYECVRFYMQKEDKEAVREAIKHLESKVLKVKYLEMNGFYDDVIDLLDETDDYSKAIDCAWKHGLYKKAADIAKKESGSEEKEAQFLLCEIYACLLKEWNDVALNILQSLQNAHILRKDGSCTQLRAQMLLIKAKVTGDTEACSNALSIFEELHNESGVIESVNVLLTVCDDSKLAPEVVLDYSLRAIRLSKVFEKAFQELSQTESGWISSYLMFHQLQRLPSGQIFVPPWQGFWLPLEHSTNSLTFSEKDAFAVCKNHLQGCCKMWLKSSNAIKKTLSKYTLHKNVQEKGLIPAKAGLIFMEYLTKLSMIAELHEAIECYPDSRKNLSVLFSPLGILHNHAWKRFRFQHLQTHVSIMNSFRADYEKILKEQESCHFASFDQCMQLWRLSLIMNGNTISLHSSLRKGSHVFLSWINATYLLSTKHRALTFISMVDRILHEMARSPAIFQSMSDENLLYIIIIQSLSSLFLVSLAWRKGMYAPRIFDFMMKNFNILVQQNSHQNSLVKACVLEIMENWNRLSDIGRIAISKLQKLLNFLLQSSLSRVLSNHDHTITRYYVILILTISVNLIIARPTLENHSVYMNLNLLVTKLESILNTTTKPPFSQYVHSRLIEARNVHDIFSIIAELLYVVKNTEIQLFLPNIQGNYLNFDVARFYPNLPLTQPLKPDYELIKILHEPEQESELLESDIELMESQESDMIPVQEQEDGLISRLKVNMIENGICKICNIDIHANVRPKSEKASDSELERQDSTENEYEMHIETSDHKQKKEEHSNFSETRDELIYCKLDVINEVKRMQKSPNLSPEDDITLTEFEDQISSIHTEIESTVHIEDSWIKLTDIMRKKIQELHNIQEKLRRMLSSTQNSDEDSETDDNHAITSPITYTDLMPKLLYEHPKEKMKRKKK